MFDRAPCNFARALYGRIAPTEKHPLLRFGLQIGMCPESFAQPPVPRDASGRNFVLKCDLMR